MPTRERRKGGLEVNLAAGLHNHTLRLCIRHRFTRLLSIQVLVLVSWSIYCPPVTGLCCLLA